MGMTALIVLIGGTLALIFLEVPVAFAMAITSVVALLLSGAQPQLFAISLVEGLDQWTWIAVPLYILTGFLMNASGITTRLLLGARTLLGHLPGGLAHAAIGVNVLMAGVSGSMMADLAATGVVFIPGMKKEGYAHGFAAGVIGAASIIGPIIPPSIPFIVYGMMTGTSISRLFVAGILPGLLIAAGLIVASYLVSKARHYPSYPRPPVRDMMARTVSTLPAVALPVIIIGGMRAGLYTVTESGGIAVIYALALGVLLYRQLNRGAVLRAMTDTLNLSIAVLFVIATASMFRVAIVYNDLADRLFAIVTTVASTPLSFLFLSIFIILVLGCFLDTTPIMVILSPLFAPIASSYGINPVHYGLVFSYATLLGMLTPPYGLGLFALSRIAGVPVTTCVRESLPLLLTLVALLLLFMLVPQISTFLPTLIFGG